MPIGDAYRDDLLAGIAGRAVTPAAPAQSGSKFSAWKAAAAPIRGVIEGLVAQPLATLAETVGGFGQVLGAYPEAAGYNPTGAARTQADAARAKLLSGGVDMNNDIGDALREAGRSYRPDPETAHAAEQLLYGLGRGMAKIVGGAVTMGPAGMLAAGAEESNSAADDLRMQGVDFATRMKAGAVQGAGLALAALPVVGQTKLATAGLYAIGGPGGFMAQQALTRDILQSAGYDKIGEQFDPTDPVGLVIASLLPAGFAAYGLRQQKLQRAVASLPDMPARDGAAPAVDPSAPAPIPSKPSAVADAVARYPSEAVDAARVVMMAERRAASNPGADDFRAMNQHEAAVAKAEDQIAAGEPVGVADVAPAVRMPAVDTTEFKAWFGDSKVVGEDGSPMVVYHGTNAEFEIFKPGTAGASWFTTDQDHAGYFGRVSEFALRADRLLEIDARNPSVLASSVDGVAAARKILAEKARLDDGEVKLDGRWISVSDASQDQIGAMVHDLMGRGGYPADEFAVRLAKETGAVYAVFKPEQIKSAIGNSGKFDPTTGSLTGSPYATWADQITAAIRELQASNKDATNAAQAKSTETAAAARSAGDAQAAADIAAAGRSADLEAARLTEEQTKAVRAEVIDLRKRESVLKSLLECLNG